MRRSRLDNKAELRAEGHVTVGSLAIAAGIALNALGGLLFWLLAARTEAAASVGEASALFQSLLFVNFVGNLGLPVAIGHFAAGSSDRAKELSNLALVVRAAAALLSAAIFLGVAASSSLLDPLWNWNPAAGIVAFAVLGIGSALAVLFEVRLISLRRWGLVVLRAALVAVVRLPLLLFVPDDPDGGTSLALFLIASAPIALSGLAGSLWLWIRIDRTFRLIPSWPADGRSIARYAGINWVGLLSTQGPIFAIPVIVAFSVDSAENAAFYVAWSFGAIVFLLPHMIGQVVLSEANLARSWIRSLLQGLRLALLLTMIAAVVARVGSGVVADVYGPEYEDIREHLPLVVAAGIGWSYTSLGLAAARVKERHLEVLLISAVFVVSTTVPAAIFTPSHGAGAAVWSWLAGTSLTAALTGLLYLRWRVDYDVVAALERDALTTLERDVAPSNPGDDGIAMTTTTGAL